MRLSQARKEIVAKMMKDTIFEAAGVVLEQHGVNGVTMERVAHAAGLATGSLYNYFLNKNELMEFIFTRFAAPLLGAVEETANGDLSARQKLENILRMSLEYSTLHKQIVRLLLETRQDYEAKRNIRPRILQLYTSIFEQGIREGTFRPHNPAYTARLFRGGLAELFDLQTNNVPSEEVNDYAAMLMQSLLNGFCVHAMQSTTSDKAKPSS
jgi:AcrR family transcriptional regulator